MKLEKKWKAAHEAVHERYFGLPEITPFRVKVLSLYPSVIIDLEQSGDRCSLCARSWWDIGPAMSHVGGLPHFRQWCLEHPTEVRERFPEAIKVLTEATLTEVSI